MVGEKFSKSATDVLNEHAVEWWHGGVHSGLARAVPLNHVSINKRKMHELNNVLIFNI